MGVKEHVEFSFAGYDTERSRYYSFSFSFQPNDDGNHGVKKIIRGGWQGFVFNRGLIEGDVIRFQWSPAYSRLECRVFHRTRPINGKRPSRWSQQQPSDAVAPGPSGQQPPNAGAPGPSGQQPSDAGPSGQQPSNAGAVLNPMAAMFGGIVGQEVIKACSGKFHPLFQFLYFDSVESLPTEPLHPPDLKPLNTQYDAQISVFGAKLQKKFEDAKVFVVECCALGCEFLNNLALIGVSCGSQGKLTITDDGVIEKSNLSRQFLFCDWNIGQSKSTVVIMNPSLRIEALQKRASPETENVFDDTFWENLNVVIYALDNVNARLYIDQRRVYFQKPLLESGTLGAKCNTQMVIPHLTENYGASRDLPEKQAPMSHHIDHCLTWARSEFEGLLEKTPAEVNAFLNNPGEYASAMRKAGDAQARETLDHVTECLEKDRCDNFQDCITWARLKYCALTPCCFESSMNPLQLEKDDDTNYHMDMIAGLANMRTRNYGISEVDKLKAKFIAGRIIPAIATSTAMATGFVCLELYKAVDGGRKVEDYRSTFANLALPLFSMAEPVPPKVIKHQDMTWTVWDHWILKDNPTLRQLLDWLQETERQNGQEND